MDPAPNLSRVSRQNPCPICGKPDWCAYNTKVAICMRTPNEYPTKNGGWKHFLSEQIITPPPPPPPVNNNKRRSDAELDKVYRALIETLPLQKRHIQHLRGRGMGDAEIAHGLYRTWPGANRSSVIKALRTRLPSDDALSGVPGFGRKNPGGHWTMTGPEGLVIPVVSPTGLIVSLVIRPDCPKQGQKYVVLSSRWLKKGASPGTRIHAALPPNPKHHDAVWITEGPLKANISSFRLGGLVLGVPGVSTWKGVFSTPLPTKIVIAYDTDYDNYHVRYHARALANCLIDRGHKVYAALWQGAKGLDDALVQELRISIVPVSKRQPLKGGAWSHVHSSSI